MSNLPEVYNGPEFNPHNRYADPAAGAPEIVPQGGGFPGDPHQSLPPYKDEYATTAQQVPQQAPQSPWTPPPQNLSQQPFVQQQQQPFVQQQQQPFVQQQQQPFIPQQQQFIPQSQPKPAARNTICGLKRGLFFIMVAVLLLIIIGAAVGAGVSISTRTKSWQPYALQTGAWNMNNIPLSQHNGICTNEYPSTAVQGCGPLNFPFVINKVGDNYQISSSPFPELNGALSPPTNEGDFYQKNFYSSDQESSFSSICISAANVTVKLGKGYQYEISNQHDTPLSCNLGNGMSTTPNQQCSCFWFGFLTR